MMLVSILQEVTDFRHLSFALGRVGLLSIACSNCSCCILAVSASIFMGRVAVAADHQIQQIILSVMRWLIEQIILRE
jgi:hypothetical protein